jgi:hypothetical protein
VDAVDRHTRLRSTLLSQSHQPASVGTVSDCNPLGIRVLFRSENLMTMFYFYICTGCERVRDSRGRTFVDIVHATRFAMRYARLLKSKADYNHIDFKVIEIRDEGGRLACTVPFTSAFARMAADTKGPILAPPTRAGAVKANSAARGWQSSLEAR